MNNNNHDRISFLTLGDGDFTYSLDLGRYLLSKNSTKGGNPSELIATGIDTKEQLCAKYKDAPFILKQLESLSTSSSSSSSKKLSVSIHHGINAIVRRNFEKVEPAAAMKADHVMFHHPHLGTEDAALHTRFLSHLGSQTTWIVFVESTTILSATTNFYNTDNLLPSSSSSNWKIISITQA
eukprot:scaffold24938_cov147-Cylindrotheca_fusiformis.AAC.2